MREQLSVVERGLKTLVYVLVRAKLRAGEERFVVLVELAFQHAQAVEFREKQSSRLADWSHRIVGMLGLPCGKILLRAGEIQIVETHESMVQRGAHSGIWCIRGGVRCVRTRDQQQGCYHTED